MSSFLCHGIARAYGGDSLARQGHRALLDRPGYPFGEGPVRWYARHRLYRPGFVQMTSFEALRHGWKIQYHLSVASPGQHLPGGAAAAQQKGCTAPALRTD